MKKTLFIVLIIFTYSCVSKKEYSKLNVRTNALIIKNEDLSNQFSIKNRIIDSLSTIIEQNNIEKENLRQKYIEATQTPQYNFSKAVDFMNIGDYKSANYIFENIILKHPNSISAENSKIKIDEIKLISSINTKSILNSVKNKTLQDKIQTIDDSYSKQYINKEDSTILFTQYDKYKFLYERDKYVITTNDKMQSCYFYETDRNTEELLYNFELYIVKPYRGKKYYRLRTAYNASNWMFYEKITVRGSNGYQFSIETKYPDKKSDSSSNGVKEWSDNLIKSDLNWKISKISEANEVVVRFDGKYRHEITLNAEQMKSLKEIVSKFIRI